MTEGICLLIFNADSPKRVLVSSRPSGGIHEGTSVPLACSSEANPPVESYTWFKRSGTEDLKIGTGQSYRIRDIRIEAFVFPENVGRDPKDDTYTALVLKTKTSDDVYESLTTETFSPYATTQV
ncbi:hypothetical protein AOLI_G00318400 [Acnodon oligacanthus]